MRLLVDIGNTRVKAVCAGDEARTELPAMATADAAQWRTGEAEAWTAVLDARPEPERVLVSNVAGASVAGAFAQWVWERWHLEAEFATVRRACAGMHTLYEEPGQLGIDRWLAALAAWDRVRGPVCVLDAGTALTVDIVDAGGDHLGGLIAPGLDLMRRSLTQGTAQLRVDALPDVERFATNTADAIALGCRESQRGLLAAVGARLAAAYPDARFAWFLTGGGAADVREFVPVDCTHVPALVLDGLHVLAGQGE